MLRFVTDRLQRWRDQWRRRFARWFWDRPNTAQGQFANRIVFIRWDAKLGDTIVLSWVFRELKRQRPDLEITVVCGKGFEDLFHRGYGITSVYLAAKRHGFAGLKEIAQKISRPRYVVHLSLMWRPRDIRFVRLLNPEHVVGLDDELRMVDVKLGALTRERHFSEKLIPWLESIGVDTRNRSYWIPRLPQAAATIDQWWPEGRVVGFCPFGASKKKYLNDFWIERIVQGFLKEKLNLVFLVVPAERQRIECLIDKNSWHRHVFLNQGQTTQYELFEQVLRCDAIFSVDTAIVHIAVGLNKPLLAIYNSFGEEFRNWHPNGLDTQILRTLPGADPSVNALDLGSLDGAVSSFASLIGARCSP